MSAGDDDRASSIPNIFHASSGQSSLACTNCRRQKTRCDRLLPSCDSCQKANRTCEYPLSSRRPGPKAGTTRRRRLSAGPEDGQSRPQKARRVRIDRETSASNSSHHENGMRSTDSDDEASLPSEIDSDIAEVAYPSHDDALFNRDPNRQTANLQTGDVFATACSRLDLSVEEGREAIRLYFDNMTAFSLFHQPTFNAKLASIKDATQVEALLASMLAFASLFVDKSSSLCRRLERVLDPVDRAYRVNRECLESDPDAPPTLHMLQALIITTLLQVYRGVRAAAWRQVGLCLRMGSELRLHRIDARSEKGLEIMTHKTAGENMSTWIEVEERRRAWWALWELDLFSSTIKQLPTTIDWSSNETNLPIPDEDWFNGVERPSCRLMLHPHERWKELQKCGNTSGQAWFVLLNSYKYEAMFLSVAPGRFAERHGYRSKDADGSRNRETEFRKMRELLQNCLSCARLALPESLVINDDFLGFKLSPGEYPGSRRVIDHHRYAVQLISQTSEFILYGRDVYQHAHLDASSSDETHVFQHSSARSKMHAVAWQRYMSAADAIVHTVRNSPPNHMRYVNANLSNAIWFAAAAQTVARLYGPANVDRQLAESNFVLLRETIHKYVSFWGVPGTLLRTLDALEERLRSLRSKSQSSAAKRPQAVKKPLDTVTSGHRGAPANGQDPVADMQVTRENSKSTEPVARVSPTSGLEQSSIGTSDHGGSGTFGSDLSAETLDSLMGTELGAMPDLHELFIWTSTFQGDESFNLDLDSFVHPDQGWQTQTQTQTY